jgi:hypothetical protein
MIDELYTEKANIFFLFKNLETGKKMNSILIKMKSPEEIVSSLAKKKSDIQELSNTSQVER